jgi:hypothetical protein
LRLVSQRLQPYDTVALSFAEFAAHFRYRGVAMIASDMMTTLLLGGLMGLLGQGARTVVGLKSMTDEAKDLGVSPNDLFQAARIVTSLLIGFLVGLAAALIYLSGLTPPATGTAPGGAAAFALDWHILLGFAVAGYAGTDFLEGFISNYLTPAAKTKALSNARQALVASVVNQLAPLGFKTAAFISSPPGNHFTVRQGHRYAATVTLNWIEQAASNDVIRQKFIDLGFRDVTATGSGGMREVQGLWTGADATVELDPHLSNVREIPLVPEPA